MRLRAGDPDGRFWRDASACSSLKLMIDETSLEPTRVLALYERGRGGSAVLREAAELVTRDAAELTVVTLAPQDGDPPACSVYAGAYNGGIREEASAELIEAWHLLGSTGERSHYERLVEGRDPPLGARAAAGRFDLVLLPARRSLRGASHPARRAVARSTGAEIRVIDG